MKKAYLYTLLFCGGLLLFYSCRKDLSTHDSNKISGITFDTTGQSSLSVFQYDTLVLNPNVNLNGLKGSDLAYEWKINLTPGALNYQLIGTERDLEFVPQMKPTKAGEFHQVLYTITDRANGLQYIMAWPLAIRNSIGEGLVIAETSDGSTTDLSHIMSPLVTTNYHTESVKHHVFSSINGTTIPGLLKQLQFTKLNSVGEIMLGISDNSIAAVKTLDYTLARMNEELFFSPVGERKPQMLGALTQSDVYVGNGKLTAVWLANSKKFGLPFDNKFTVPAHVALNGRSDNPAVVISFYEEVAESFVYQASVSFGDKNMHAMPDTNQGAFNAGHLPGKVNVAAATSQSGEFLHLLKDKTTGAYGLYVLEGGSYDANWTFVPPAPKTYVDLSDAPEIADARYFVLLDDQKVMYYGTKTKIYAVLYGSSTHSYAERYTLTGGDEITTLQVYRQADYPKRLDGSGVPYLATNNKQLILSTYNGTEGKVHLLPMKNIGLGNIDKDAVKTYGGFKRITAIGTQL
ncbi:MAG TPA: PKD-like family lipoprotein [Chitinophagaceae bacterium]